jgi:hypothetical protein
MSPCAVWLSRSKGYRYGVLFGPPVFQSLADHIPFAAESSRPFRETHSLVADGYSASQPCVLLLLFMCRPSTISRLVIPVIVTSVKRVLIGSTWPHIVVKVLKRVQPPITDCNTAPAVTFICSVIRITASLYHSIPNPILGRSREPVLGYPLNAIASAGSTCAETQIAPGYDLSRSALTSAQPSTIWALGVRSNVFNNSPSSELRLWYNWNSHLSTLLNRLRIWLEPAEHCERFAGLLYYNTIDAL